MKTCKECGADISNRGNRSSRCEHCQEIYGREHNLEVKRAEYRDFQIQRGPRICKDCGQNIDRRPPAAKRCKGCSFIHRHKKLRCIDCGGNIGHLGKFAVRCLDCVQKRLLETRPDARSVNPPGVPNRKKGSVQPVGLSVAPPLRLDNEPDQFRPLTVPDYLK